MARASIRPPTEDAPLADDVRVDGLSGATVVIAGHRQHRPNQPDESCPFCPGGLEAPRDYDVGWFPNRWPAMAAGRCEVLLYAPQHDASLPELGRAHVRKVVDLWAARSEAVGARADVAYVLIFENRGRAVGATIDHPHGQLYAFRDVPPVPLAEAAQTSGAAALDGAIVGSRAVADAPCWRAWVPEAPVHPIEVLLGPDDPVPDLPSLDDGGRDGLAALLVDVLARIDAVCGPRAPYMLFVHQRPFDGRPWPIGLHVHVQSPWRSAGLLRYVAAGELGSGVFFNPVVPEELADRLRAADPVPHPRLEDD
jgi:UDPglucose--hexose-1-phosphate uridylyltransferase